MPGKNSSPITFLMVLKRSNQTHLPSCQETNKLYIGFGVPVLCKPVSGTNVFLSSKCNFYHMKMFGWFKNEEKPPIDTSQFHIPEFYRGTDGPLIKVLDSCEEYETRLYDKTQWVSSKSPPGEFMGAFWRLYSYIGGKNDQGKKMDMNMPVRMHITLSEDDVDGTKVDDFVVSFYLSSSLLPNLPKPTDEQVFLEQEDRRVTYVHNFSGMASEKDWKVSRARLRAALERDGKCYMVREYFSAGYDPPYKLWNRRNEMILIADPQPDITEDEQKPTSE